MFSTGFYQTHRPRRKRARLQQQYPSIMRFPNLIFIDVKDRLRKFLIVSPSELNARHLLSNTTSQSISDIIKLYPYSVKMYAYVLSKYKYPITQFKLISNFDFTDYKEKDILENEYNELKSAMYKEINFRVQMKKIVAIWLYKKYKNRLINKEDPATLEPPRNPVYLFSYSDRGSWTFDASSLRTHINSMLGKAYSMYSKPMIPKNPLTNVPFSDIQLYSLVSQLRAHNKTSWLIEGYHSERFSIVRFTAKFDTRLRMHVLSELIKDIDSDEYIDCLQTFVEYEMEYHNCYVDHQFRIIAWAIKNKKSSSYIKDWRRQFKNYYTAKILGFYSEDSIYPPEDMIYKVRKETYRLLKSYHITSEFAVERMQISN